MCLLLLGFKKSAQLPVIVAANRDEFYDRPTEPPQLIADRPRVLAGRDVRAGGTWLGVNEYGLLVAVTNRHTDQPEQPGLPSRGALCLEALKCDGAEAAAVLAADHSSREPHNPFNLLAVDPDHAFVISNLDGPRPEALSPGWHVIANQALDDVEDPRVTRAAGFAAGVDVEDPSELLSSLEAICRDHGNENGNALCVHGKQAGTRSSSIVLISNHRRITWQHTDSAPCQEPYQRLHMPWQRP